LNKSKIEKSIAVEIDRYGIPAVWINTVDGIISDVFLCGVISKTQFCHAIHAPFFLRLPYGESTLSLKAILP
jgi:hypothetical protein